MEPPGLFSVGGTSLKVLENVRLVTQIDQWVAETGFIVEKSLAGNELLGTAIIRDNVDSTNPDKQLIHPIRSRSIVILCIDCKENVATYVIDQSN